MVPVTSNVPPIVAFEVTSNVPDPDILVNEALLPLRSISYFKLLSFKVGFVILALIPSAVATENIRSLFKPINTLPVLSEL